MMRSVRDHPPKKVMPSRSGDLDRASSETLTIRHAQHTTAEKNFNRHSRRTEGAKLELIACVQCRTPDPEEPEICIGQPLPVARSTRCPACRRRIGVGEVAIVGPPYPGRRFAA